MKDSEKNQEIEAKFPVKDLRKIQELLEFHQAELLMDKSYEHNILLDTPTNELLEENARLRLRKEGSESILTYKRTRKNENNIAYREEIETRVDHFENTRLILNRLGFLTFFEYEKYRSTYRLGATTIMLDETPIGFYLEIEGPDEETIHRTASLLEIDWNQRTDKSYLQVFQEWAAENGYTGRDMLFCSAPFLRG
ncbi:MAG TPA: class IV adenylate cyclase [Flexilinea sp.]|nr:class IV adenylate cyclase [Flexilinea sp.]HQJ01846.1 class IV adenylate cyclase [Flexilinea sp.]